MSYPQTLESELNEFDCGGNEGSFYEDTNENPNAVINQQLFQNRQETMEHDTDSVSINIP